jgi:ABC-2 type transport system permease protein
MRRKLIFLFALWKANLLSAMEYRLAFISQVLGMVLNDGVYFIFWVIFFSKFKEVRGWVLNDMFLMFGIVAAGFGLATYLFGNSLNLADLISQGQLDYYLSLPQPVLLHVIASRSVASGFGDFTYGVISFFMAGYFTLEAFGRFVLGVLISTVVCLSFFILVQSLAFWTGNAQMLSSQAVNALISFASYPITLFDGTAKLLLFTLIPAAFLGGVPAEFVRSASWESLLLLITGGGIFLGLALFTFHRGLRRYESGSSIQIQV